MILPLLLACSDPSTIALDSSVEDQGVTVVCGEYTNPEGEEEGIAWYVPEGATWEVHTGTWTGDSEGRDSGVPDVYWWDEHEAWWDELGVHVLFVPYVPYASPHTPPGYGELACEVTVYAAG